MSPTPTAWEAKCAACWLEPHMRLRLTAGTVTGKPASITPSLPTFAPCSPAWVTVPFITSSIFSASNPARCKSPSRVRARRASGRTSRKAPPLLANGVRTASRIIGSLISVTIYLLLLQVYVLSPAWAHSCVFFVPHYTPHRGEGCDDRPDRSRAEEL